MKAVFPIRMIVLLIFTCALVTNLLHAQTFVKGSKALNAGLGFGWRYSYYGTVNSLPALNVSYEKGVVDIKDFGTISIGGVADYKSLYYNYSTGGYRASWTYFGLGLRGAIHPKDLQNDKFDTYGGLMIGVRSVTYKDTYFDSQGSNSYNYA